MNKLIFLDKNFYTKENLSQKSFLMLRFFFMAYILLLPIGRAPREIATAGCILSLIVYYATSYNQSNLFKYKLKYLLFLFCGYIIINSLFFTINIDLSAKASISGVFKGVIFLLAGMEIVRQVSDIKKLVIVYAITAFYEGLDGIYQFFYGQDFIRSTAAWGQRLTGSLITPRVGNLMSLLAPIALGIYFITKKHFSFLKNTIIFAILLFPSIFLLYGSKTRSGWVGFVLSIIALLYITNAVKFKKIIITSVILFAIVTSLPGRANIETIMSDARFELWETAFSVFKQYPITGSGFNTFEYAYDKMGIIHEKSENMPHPHNVYMQFLAEGGIVGFGLLLAFLFGNLIWSGRKIKALLQSNLHKFIYIAFFWASYAGYLATAISGHSFFRLWWLGMGMGVLGVTLGGSLLQPDTQDKNTQSPSQKAHP
jgi:O-antigen ligase